MKRCITSFVLFLLTTVFSQNKIAVTIDDLPLQRIGSYSKEQYESLTKKLLTNLSLQKVPVIGFVNEGKLFTNNKLDENKVALLKQWLDAGFELGNHSFSHKSANQISAEEFNGDILKGEQVIRNLVESSGKRLEYFRHPFLHTGLSIETRNTIESFLTEHGYTIAPITFDNSEWIYSAAYDKAIKEKNEQMMNKIGEDYLSYMKHKLEYWESQSVALFNRNISQTLLIHANALNAEYFDELCEMIREKNYAFVTLDEALKDEAYESPDTFIKNNGISWIHRWAITQGKKKDFFGNEPEASKWIADYAGIDYE
ncbi:MAG: pgdA [Ignavibacteria bacterium]|nr:MAG: pgdA [Ignavibacteria bacterium]